MGWKEVKARYKKGNTLAQQSSEDIIARRVLRGLGFVQCNIYALERALFSTAYKNDTLWDRVQRILKSVYMKNGMGFRYRTWHIEAVEAAQDGKEVMDRLSLANDMEPATQPIVMCRVRHSKTVLTYTLEDPENLQDYEPPYKIIDKYEIHDVAPADACRLVLVQETEHFIAQFGPYRVDGMVDE